MSISFTDRRNLKKTMLGYQKEAKTRNEHKGRKGLERSKFERRDPNRPENRVIQYTGGTHEQGTRVRSSFGDQ